MPMDAVDENADEDEADPDDRKPQKIWDRHVAPETELSDSYVPTPSSLLLGARALLVAGERAC